MRAARLAEPGERFFVMGRDPEALLLAGFTGTALRLSCGLSELNPNPGEDTSRAYMIVEFDTSNQHRIPGLARDLALKPSAMPREFLYAQIDDDNDTEDAEPTKKAVSA